MWYHPTKPSGKGIGDRKYYWPEIKERLDTSVDLTKDRNTSWPQPPTDEERRQGARISRLGRDILSTPPHDPITYERIVDTMAQNLRQDIDNMAADLQHRKILFTPSSERSINDFKSRAQAMNGISWEEWKEKRDALFIVQRQHV